jgi:dTDP-4-amino-4,6-dideoxygalactose transaminase
LPIGRWRRIRRRNHALLADRLTSLEWLRVLWPESPDCVPFSVVLVIDEPGRRERVRAALNRQQIYAAILWPIEETALPVPETTRALSRHILSLPCDFRYDEDDLTRVAAHIGNS